MTATAPAKSQARYVAAKVPEITAVFWVIKILTTGMGEACSDFLGNWFLPAAGVVGIFGFAGAMWWQLRSDRYRPVVYWTAVAMVAVTGTMAADMLHIIGLPYQVTTVVYAAATGLLFWRWYRSEGTLSIHSIITPRRERYYWLTVGASFALGTAVGDLTAATMHLGFLNSGWLFLAAIAVPFIAWKFFGLHEIPAFWTAYVLTRPLGASFADWIGKPPSITGLGLGDGTITGILLAAIVALVAWLAWRGHGVQPHDEELWAELDALEGDPV